MLLSEFCIQLYRLKCHVKNYNTMSSILGWVFPNIQRRSSLFHYTTGCQLFFLLQLCLNQCLILYQVLAPLLLSLNSNLKDCNSLILFQRWILVALNHKPNCLPMAFHLYCQHCHMLLKRFYRIFHRP